MPKPNVLVPYAPDLLPDESLYSWLARLTAMDALGPYRDAVGQLFGSRNVVTSTDLPSRIEAMLAALGPNSPFVDGDQVIAETSVYGYHRPFLTPERHATARAIMLRGDAKGLKTIMGRVANRFGADPPLRSCRKCFEDDAARDGIPYWRRSHQLPGIDCCHAHGILLNRTDAGPSLRRGRFVLPDVRTPQSGAVRAASTQHSFATLSRELLLADLQPAEPLARQQVYEQATIDKGLVRPGGGIDFRGLAEEVARHHRDFEVFSFRARLQAPSDDPAYWLRPLVRRPSRAAHPICHLLLIGFLFGTIERFASAIGSTVLEQKAITAAVEGSRPVSKGRSVCALGDELMRDRSMSCRTVAARMGVSVTTVVSRRRAIGVPIAERRKTVDAGRIAAIKRALSSGVPPAEIASNLGVSLSAVYRIRAQHPRETEAGLGRQQDELLANNRKAWCRALADVADGGTASARQLAPAAYAWLYRHDRSWLQARRSKLGRTPPARSMRPRIDWGERDRMLCARLDNHLRSLHEEPNRKRITRSRLVVHLGERMVRSNMGRLPLLDRLLEDSTESVEEYEMYRIGRAFDTLTRAGEPLQPWRVFRRAGVKDVSPTMRAVVESMISEASRRP